MVREAFLQGAALVAGLQPCDLERMRNGQLVLVERLLRFGNELNQAQSPTDVRGRSADTGRDTFDCVRVRLQLNERSVSLRFIERMHVHSLDVLDLSSVRKKRSTTYTTVDSQRHGILIYS